MSRIEEAIRAVDPTGQLDDVRALPDHLGDALWRVESARLEPRESPDGVLVCGMGGSAIGGDLAAAALGDRLQRPLGVVRGYGLPSWTPAGALVFCSSYSGSTEETLGCYEAAGVRGADRIVATTGGTIGEWARRDGVPVIGLPAGLQPRAAVGYTFVTAVEVAALAGAGPSLWREVERAAEHLLRCMGDLEERAEGLAATLEGAVPIVYGAGLTAPVAYRWKCQVNENAKCPAFSHELPEMDHNELVGWEGASGSAGRHAAIFLCDRDQHERERRRIELTAELVSEPGRSVVTVESEGDTPTERLLWTVLLGDLLSLRIAASRGVDPAPVAVIETLKDRLGRPGSDR